MKPKNLIQIFIGNFFVFSSTQSFAKTIKWSMQGDSLTLRSTCSKRRTNYNGIKTNL